MKIDWAALATALVSFITALIAIFNANKAKALAATLAASQAKIEAPK